MTVANQIDNALETEALDGPVTLPRSLQLAMQVNNGPIAAKLSTDEFSDMWIELTLSDGSAMTFNIGEE